MASTIQISNETKNLIGTFGAKGDTYEVIIKRMYDFAVKEQLREFLLSSKDTRLLKDYSTPGVHGRLCHRKPSSAWSACRVLQESKFHLVQEYF
jgi:hypothetical protein